jgi:hypothetical protein
MVTDTPDGVVLDVRVIPRASKAGVGGIRDGALLIRLHAPPVDGAANGELIDVLAKVLGVPRRAITIVAGEKARLKRVRVAGLTKDAVDAAISSRLPDRSR